MAGDEPVADFRPLARTGFKDMILDGRLRPGDRLALSDFGLEHLLEVRLMLEPGAAAQAAERATDDELEAIRECARSGSVRDLTTDELVRLDVELHERLAGAAHNPLLERLLATIAALAEESRGYTVHLPAVAQRTAGEHRNIVDAICARDPERARVAMGDHIHRIRDAAVAHQNRARASARAVTSLTRT